MLQIFTDKFDQMCDALRNYSMLNVDSNSVTEINKNQKIVRSLHEKIESLASDYESVQ